MLLHTRCNPVDYLCAKVVLFLILLFFNAHAEANDQLITSVIYIDHYNL